MRSWTSLLGLLGLNGCLNWDSLYGVPCNGGFVNRSEDCQSPEPPPEPSGAVDSGACPNGHQVEQAGEDCPPPVLPPDSSPPSTTAKCGNGQVDEREECDDGNADDGDACLNTCTMARCGDGQVRRVIEECDDGNAVDSDGCSNRCLACGGANSGFVWLENEHCYTVHDGPLNWNAASAACGDLGGHLTTTFNSLELDAVTQGLPGVPTRPIWLGLRRGAGNLFAWVTGEELRNTFWPGQAAPKDGACVTLDRKLNEWAAEDCDSVHAYSCEREAWTAFDGATNAYQVFYQLKSFPEAKAACERRGAHLATVFDKNEHGAVALLTQSSFWIGAEAATVNPKVFSWVTGETVVYENFAFAEPNEDQTNDTCVIIGNDEAWHDRGCGELHAYACEVD